MKFRRTTLFIVGLVAFLGGLGLSRLNYTISGPMVALLGIFSLVALRRKKPVAVVGVLLFGLTLGLWRGGNYSRELRTYGQLQGQKVVMRVTAESDGVYGDKAQLVFDGDNITVIEPIKQQIPGRVSVKGFGVPAVYRGDVVLAEGKLYQTRGSRQATISFADMKVLGRSDSPIESLRLQFAAGMQNALPEPLASFGLGLLIGQRSTLPDYVSADLAAVGLTHIIAVSGYNLTIIIRSARRVVGKRSKYQALVASLFLIGAFLLFTGFSASIVRAGIVSTLSLLAWYYGRTFRPVLLLLLVAALTAGWYPLYLWSDIGWYLSFLAFFGVLALAPLISRRIFKEKHPNNLTQIIIESISAQLMTAPLILFIFKQVSLIGLFSNVLIVPLVPLAMLLSLVAGIAGMVTPLLAGLVAWPAKILLTYMLDLAHVLASIPRILLARTLSLSAMVFIYGAVVVISWVLWRKTLKTVKITDVEIEEHHNEWSQ